MRSFNILVILLFFLMGNLYGQVQELLDLNQLVREAENKLHKDFETGKTLLGKIKKHPSFYQKDSVQVAYHRLKGDYFLLEYEIDSAEILYRRGITMASSHSNDQELGLLYHKLSNVFRWKNILDSALVYEEKTIHHAKLAKNVVLEQNARISIAKLLSYQGKWIESNDLLFQLIDEIPDESFENKGIAYSILAGNYLDLGIGHSVEEYFQKAGQYLKQSPNKQLAANNMANLVNYYNDRKRYDEALMYVDSIVILADTDRSRLFFNLHKSLAYKGLQEWDLALTHIDSTLYYDRLSNDDYGYAADMITKGQIYLRKGDYVEAVEVLSEAKDLFEEGEFSELTMEKQLYRDLVASYVHLRIPELENDFYHFTDLYEQVASQGSDKNLAEMEVKYEASQKDKQIALQRLKLEKEKNNRLLMWSGFGLLAVMATGGFWLYSSREKRKSLQRQNTLLGLQQTLNEMELAGLNQQLNPHEIKNLLAAISPEIQEKAPQSYRQMLRLFNLTKASLNVSSLTEPVNKQLRQVEDYLALMKTVMVEPLDYEVDNQLTRQDVPIPRFLLKNMVQNAVKHGIKGKREGGFIKVSLKNQNGFDEITIEDNGFGFDSEKFNTNGIGLSTYLKIFETLNKKNSQSARFDIFGTEEGTRVEILIPAEYEYE